MQPLPDGLAIMENLSEAPTPSGRKGRGLSLFSGGLDSQLAVRVLTEQGVHVEAVIFDSPFFGRASDAVRSAEKLGVKVHVVDFTPDIVALIKDPPHGFGSCMNPCIDCHAAMIRRAGELMEKLGFDFVCTGEVLGQRPMSQQRAGMNAVRKSSGLGDRLLRPLSALLLEETYPERAGLVDRSKLLGLEGRNRKPQMELAEKYGIKSYPSPAGGCKLTESGYSKRLANLKEHEGLDDFRLVRVLNYGRHFRLPGGTLVVVGRNRSDNEALRSLASVHDAILRTPFVPGPSVLAVNAANAEDMHSAELICAAYADSGERRSVTVRTFLRSARPSDNDVPVVPRGDFSQFMI